MSCAQTRDQDTDTEDNSSAYESITTSSTGTETQLETKTEATAKPPETSDPPTPSVASTPIPNSHFICTFCWTPQYPPSKPKLVGSSRIACTTCWKEVLDLSICWVCGEQIVRGEEVVSLGWCFWHKGCFGCLLCGRALPVPSGAYVDVEGWEGDGREKGRGKEERKKRERGVELESIPLCVDCGTETDGQEEIEILERGLETVGRFDGGLSRSRLMRISEATEQEREADGLSMRWVSALICGKPSHGVTERERKYSEVGRSKRGPAVGSDAMPMISDSVGWIPAEDDPGGEREEGGQKEEIYVSILNPLHEPVFRPSKTKPLPKWMALLPGNKRTKSDAACPPGRRSHSMGAPSAVIAQPILKFPHPPDSPPDSSPETNTTPIAEGIYLDLGSSSYLPTNTSTDIQEVIAPKPSAPQIESLERRPSPSSSGMMGESLADVVLPPRPPKEQLESLTRRSRSTFPILNNKNLAGESSSSSNVRKNPFVRAGSLGMPVDTPLFTRPVSTDGSVYFTPLERPKEDAFPRGNGRRGGREERDTVARPKMQREREVTGFPFFQPLTPAKDSPRGTPLGAQGRATADRVSPNKVVTPLTTAEFLDKYQPASPNGTIKERYAVGKVGRVIERFGGRKESGRRLGKGEGEKDGEDGGDGMKRVLRKELRNLFEEGA